MVYFVALNKIAMSLCEQFGCLQAVFRLKRFIAHHLSPKFLTLFRICDPFAGHVLSNGGNSGLNTRFC